MEANHRVSPPKWQSETHDETSQPSNTVPIQKIKGLLFLWPHPSTQNKMDLLDLYSRYGLKDPPKGVRPKEFHPDEFHGSHGRRLLYCIYIYIIIVYVYDLHSLLPLNSTSQPSSAARPIGPSSGTVDAALVPLLAPQRLEAHGARKRRGPTWRAVERPKKPKK